MRPSQIVVLGVVGLLSSLASPSWSDTDASHALVRVEQHDEAMGATFSIVLHGTDRAALEAAANAAFDEAQRLDQLLSNYRPTSEWSAMNRGAATRPVRVSDELFALLQNCMTYSRQSEGAFDITVGPLMKLWGFFEGEGELAGRAQVINTLRRVGYRHVQLDLAAKTVAFERPGMELDPGGIGKGYAIDRMVDVLKRHRVRIALLSASGSSIYGMGSPPAEPGGWKVKIRAPRDPRASVAEVRLQNMSISTSGGYEKFFWANGRAYSHIIDPRSGYPARGTAAVSVVAPRAVDSEAWTKPFFVNGRTWTAAHKPADVRVLFCEDVPAEPCTWIQ